MTAVIVGLIDVVLMQIMIGCSHAAEVPRLEKLTSAQVFQAEIILVARVDAVRDGGTSFVDGVRIRKKFVSLSQIRIVRGSNLGKSELVAFAVDHNDPAEREEIAAVSPGVGEWRVWFLRLEGDRLRAIQDDGVYSLLTASEQSVLELSAAETVPEIVARLVLIPSGGAVQPHYPSLIGRLAELVAVPLVGRTRTFFQLEQLLLHKNIQVRTRACEALLYATGTPHYCIDQRSGDMATTGISSDEGVINALAVQKNAFGRLDSVEEARSVTFKRCVDGVPASFVGPVDSRADCAGFADAVAASLSPTWLKSKPRR